MFRIIKSVLVLFVLALTITSCEKEMSQETGGLSAGGTQSGTAVFTLDGAPGGCVTPLINGDYVVGTAMDITNSVIATVNVSVVGTYTISTALINGIKFTASGTFASAGPQSITLFATGTPVAAMTATYIPGTSGCSFQVTAITGSVTPVLQGTLDCATATLGGTFTQSIALNSSNSISIPVNVTTAGSYSIATTLTNGCTFTGSGTLATGSQTIVLTGTGTPANAGAVSIPVTLGSSNCNVSITFAPAPPPADGTLNCATATVSGTYTQGLALDAGSTVSVPINVTTAGLYNITTTAQNGCTFSGSGLLAAGAQTIVLTGSGTPTAAGTFNYPITVGASNCSFSITYTTAPTDYFRVKINGVLKSFNTNLLGDPSPLFSGMNTIAISGDLDASGSESLDLTVNDISPIAPGTFLHPLGVKFSTSRYVDASFSGWQPSDASSPAYSVIVTSVSGNRIVGTFSGQYKDLNGTGTNSIQFTNGEFSVPY